MNIELGYRVGLLFGEWKPPLCFTFALNVPSLISEEAQCISTTAGMGGGTPGLGDLQEAGHHLQIPTEGEDIDPVQGQSLGKGTDTAAGGPGQSPERDHVVGDPSLERELIATSRNTDEDQDHCQVKEHISRSQDLTSTRSIIEEHHLSHPVMLLLPQEVTQDPLPVRSEGEKEGAKRRKRKDQRSIITTIGATPTKGGWSQTLTM